MGFADRATQNVGGGKEQNTEQFVTNVDDRVDRNPSLGCSSNGYPSEIPEIAKELPELVTEGPDDVS